MPSQANPTATIARSTISHQETYLRSEMMRNYDYLTNIEKKLDPHTIRLYFVRTLSIVYVYDQAVMILELALTLVTYRPVRFWRNNN